MIDMRDCDRREEGSKMSKKNSNGVSPDEGRLMV
jgi:hypothetical protein